jgi:hypothetical protein
MLTWKEALLLNPGNLPAEARAEIRDIPFSAYESRMLHLAQPGPCSVFLFGCTIPYKSCMGYRRPPLWSSGQSSWLQIRRPGLDSRHYQKKKLVGMERGQLSLVSTNEELLDRKVAAPV